LLPHNLVYNRLPYLPGVTVRLNFMVCTAENRYAPLTPALSSSLQFFLPHLPFFLIIQPLVWWVTQVRALPGRAWLPALRMDMHATHALLARPALPRNILFLPFETLHFRAPGAGRKTRAAALQLGSNGSHLDGSLWTRPATTTRSPHFPLAPPTHAVYRPGQLQPSLHFPPSTGERAVHW